MAGRLEGKVALVTGGCSGIGEATAALFLAEGASVVLADLQDPTPAQTEAMANCPMTYQRADVTQEGDIRSALSLADARFGGLDILVSNAGSSGAAARIEDLAAEDWDKTLALLLRAQMLGIKHAIPLMRRRGGGSVINTGSIAALRAGLTAAVSYSVAKAGVIKLTTTAALEVAPDGIRVNCIHPGAIATPIFGAGLGLSPAVARSYLGDVEEIYSKAQPLQITGRPEHVAQAALFLASDESAFITGTEFIVDGGMSLLPAMWGEARQKMKDLGERITGVRPAV